MTSESGRVAEWHSGKDSDTQTSGKAPHEYEVGFVVTVLETMIRGHLRKLRFDGEDFNVRGMLNPTEIRNGIIRGKYRKIRADAAAGRNGEAVKETMELLGKQFGLCPEMIKDIVSGRR